MNSKITLTLDYWEAVRLKPLVLDGKDMRQIQANTLPPPPNMRLNQTNTPNLMMRF